ncbi:TlpA disulfide reductase family protein [Hydrogenophaga sp. SNF1]|nr:TlpA disulfide reductase family protein [Hydrogenophaga sp. SNF1]WQB84664.1 TlpA disulfide reductase family protein [Hydrogenophaga sp. SNF1]
MAMKMQRRHWLAGGVALAAAGTGAWWADRRLSPTPVLDGAETAFWQTAFETPEGGSLAVASWRGSPLLVNFWATWCPPCVEELPLLNAFHEKQAPKGWQFLALAVDRVEPVRQFLQRLPLRFPVGMTGFAGTDLSRSLGNATGALPFTVVFGPDGRAVHRKIGQVHEAELTAWAGSV